MDIEIEKKEEYTNGMKVLAVLGSPRKAGYGSKLMTELLKEFPKGTKIDTYTAYELNPTPCNACGYCKACDGCSKKDLDIFMRQFADADVVIFAVPDYNLGVPAPMKALIDRFQRYYEQAKRQNVSSIIPKKRDALLIVTSGCDGEVGFEIIKHQFLQVFSYLNIELKGTMLARNTNKAGIDATDMRNAQNLYRSLK